MLIMTTSGVYKTRNVRRRPELERWDFEFFTTLKGTPRNPNPAAGEVAADALPADITVPMPAPAPVPQIVVALAPVDFGCRSVMVNTTTRAHSENCRMKLENMKRITLNGSSKTSC